MSKALLDRVNTFLTEQNLIGDYSVKFFRWKDGDLKGKADFILLQMAGTSGARDSIVQRPDVRLLIVGKQDELIANDMKSKSIYDAFARNVTTSGVIKFEPLAVVLGPFELDNGRVAFEMIIRCFVQDY